VNGSFVALLEIGKYWDMGINQTFSILSVCLLGSSLAVFVSYHQGARRGAQTDVPPSPGRSTGTFSSVRDRLPGESLFIKLPGRNQNLAKSESAPAVSPFPENGSWDEIRDWVTRNPNESLAWVSNSPPGSMRDDVSELICLQKAQSDCPQALALAESLGGSHTTIVLENVTQQWAEQDALAAYAWAVNKPAGKERDRLLGRIAYVESKTHPEDAARLVALQISPGATQDEAAISVLYQWTTRDADAAMAWAQSFPEGNLRDRAIKEVEGAARFNSNNQQWSLRAP
jgi:hypothetical protein